MLNNTTDLENQPRKSGTCSPVRAISLLATTALVALVFKPSHHAPVVVPTRSVEHDSVRRRLEEGLEDPHRRRTGVEYASCDNTKKYCTGITAIDNVLHDANIKTESNICHDNSAYKWDAFCESLSLMKEVDETNEQMHFFLGGKKNANTAEGLANIASFLSQAMFETGGTRAGGDAFNYCDENPHLNINAGLITGSCTQRESDRAPYTSNTQNMWQPNKSCGGYDTFQKFFDHYRTKTFEASTGPSYKTVYDVLVKASVTMNDTTALTEANQKLLKEEWCKQWDTKATALKAKCDADVPEMKLPARDSHKKWITDCYDAGVKEGDSLCGCPHWNSTEHCFTSTNFDTHGYEDVSGLNGKQCPIRVYCEIKDAGKDSDGLQKYTLSAKATFPEGKQADADLAKVEKRTKAVLAKVQESFSAIKDYSHTSGSYSNTHSGGGTAPKLKCAPNENPSCCWWGRGAIQVTGPTNVYDLEEQCLNKITSIAATDKDICESPDKICKNDKIKWISAINFWIRNVQTQEQFPDSLKKYVELTFDNAQSKTAGGGVSFSNGCGGAVNNGGWKNHAHEEEKRTQNFEHLIQKMRDVNATGHRIVGSDRTYMLEKKANVKSGTGVLKDFPAKAAIDPRSRCGTSWDNANTKCGQYCTNESTCPEGESCHTELDFYQCFPACTSDSDCSGSKKCLEIYKHSSTSKKSVCCDAGGCPVPNDFSKLGRFESRGQKAWLVGKDDATRKTLVSGDIDDKQFTMLNLTVTREECIAGCKMSFEYKVESESDNANTNKPTDYFQLLTDGKLKETDHGPHSGSSNSFTEIAVTIDGTSFNKDTQPKWLNRGEETVFSFRYEKDLDSTVGNDKVTIQKFELYRLDKVDAKESAFSALTADGSDNDACKAITHEWDPRHDATLRCGKTWSDANSKCGRSAETSAQGADACYPKDKYKCYAVSADACSGLGSSDPRHGTTARCGWNYRHAQHTCGKKCSSPGEDSECYGAGDGFCFKDLTARADSLCSKGTTRCGASFDEANTHCGPSCEVNSECERCDVDTDCECPGGCTGTKECKCQGPTSMTGIDEKFLNSGAGVQKYCQCVEPTCKAYEHANDAGNCEDNVCKCANGTKIPKGKDGATDKNGVDRTCTTHDANLCKECNAGYTLIEGQCKANSERVNETARCGKGWWHAYTHCYGKCSLDDDCPEEDEQYKCWGGLTDTSYCANDKVQT